MTKPTSAPRALIMAGGGGTRFWPRSRQNLPKQFLAMRGERSLLQETADRLEGLVAGRDLMVITGKAHVGLTREQLPEVVVEHAGSIREHRDRGVGPHRSDGLGPGAGHRAHEHAHLLLRVPEEPQRRVLREELIARYSLARTRVREDFSRRHGVPPV